MCTTQSWLYLGRSNGETKMINNSGAAEVYQVYAVCLFSLMHQIYMFILLLCVTVECWASGLDKSEYIAFPCLQPGMYMYIIIVTFLRLVMLLEKLLQGMCTIMRCELILCCMIIIILCHLFDYPYPLAFFLIKCRNLTMCLTLSLMKVGRPWENSSCPTTEIVRCLHGYCIVSTWLMIFSFYPLFSWSLCGSREFSVR